MFKKFDLPPIWTILAIAFVLLFNAILPTPSLKAFLKPWFGYILMVYAVYIAVWAALTFRKFQTPIHPHETPKQLLRSGPYALIRNPIYSAMLVFTAGTAILCGSIYGYLPVIALFFVLRQRFVEPEEQRLIETFGAEAEDYIHTHRRW